MEQLRKANQQVKNGQVIVKAMEELESLQFIERSLSNEGNNMVDISSYKD